MDNERETPVGANVRAVTTRHMRRVTTTLTYDLPQKKFFLGQVHQVHHVEMVKMVKMVMVKVVMMVMMVIQQH